MKILVFIVSYEAERHLRSVLNRVPAHLFEDERVHFLIIDDASSDAGPELARDWVLERDARRFTVLRNPVNQGYGGNQKIGYRYAIDEGFDFVILLHGDGQYAPELIPRFIETFERTGAGAVLGSRMRRVRTARGGGMPYYKIVGNRILTWFQNMMTGQRLSEYHTGYRGYSTDFLRRVPFEIDTNEFHFDTEILLQAISADVEVVELDIPTHYGDEVCHVDGLRYAKDVVLTTLQWKMHQKGMFCSLKYRDLRRSRYRDKTDALYSSHRQALAIAAERAPERLLDIGCGPGFVASHLGDMDIEVTGIDKVEPPPGRVARFHEVDLERESLPVDPSRYDMIFMLDVIEHLAEPEDFLLGLRHQSALTGEAPDMVISTPNVAFAAVRASLLLGRFNYADSGILDTTHKRLFTRSSLLTLLRDCGYVVERVRPVAPPFEVVFDGRLGRLLGWIGNVLSRLWPTMFAFQFIVTCRPLPGARQLLDRAEEYYGSPAEEPGSSQPAAVKLG